MPGRSSKSSSSFSRRSSSPRSSYKAPAASTPPPTAASAPPTPSVVHHNHEIERPGFFSNMWTGFGLGAGQSIAHNIFRSDPVVKHVHEPSVPAATAQSITAPKSDLEAHLPKEFIQCMKDNNNY